jgi:hypothetical protein
MKRFYTFLTLAVLLSAPALAQMAPPVPMTPADYANVATGQPVELVVRVTSFRRTALAAELLSRETDTLYRATGKSVDLYFPADTPVVMGTAADVKPGAILYVDGVATSPGHADVKKAVALTGYVKVE